MNNIEAKVKEFIPVIKQAMPDEKRIEFALKLFADEIGRQFKSELQKELNRLGNKLC